MVRLFSRLRLGHRAVALGLVASVAALAGSTETADARRHRSKASTAHRAKASSYNPPYSAIVVDANSGKVLHASAPDGLRHPASLTKIMTLYLLFERLEAGKIKLSTPLTVSAHAASMAPSKLDLDPGETIRVEDAIKAVVTKSANDIAVVIAEAVGGDEPTFAKMMTRKARMLGMKNTLYRNASGLPNPEQITTARDQALLGRAIQERFPKYYAYFSTHTFTFQGRAMRNHNHLLGKVEGVDGIKTGYVAASGFNLVTSLRRAGRHLVAVVMGGRSASSRDARMRELISENISLAAAKRTAPPIIEVAESTAPVTVASAAETVPVRAAAAMPQTAEGDAAENDSATISAPMALTPPPVAQNVATPGSTDDLKPIAVKTVKVKASTLQTHPIGTAMAAPAPQPVPVPREREEAIAVASVSSVAPPKAGESTATATPAQAAISVPANAAPHGWMIQVGALETRKDANERISAARAKAHAILARAKAFTEEIVKNDMKLYRARFSGISKDDAENACKTLKSVKIVCMALRN
jgi:D-alanyl-D-alanine carboxypeptidase